MINDNGYLKGSKWNPYTHDEFQLVWGTDNWHGGWFEDNGLKYGSSDGEHIFPNSPILGSKTNPFTWELYQEMMNAGLDVWPGGWVVSANPSNGLLYIIGSSDGISRYDDLMNELGSVYYPVSQEVYRNMCENGIWEGGYIYYYNQYGHLEKYYVNRGEFINFNTGCGSGCGSASGGEPGIGSGSGSGEWNGLGCGFPHVQPGSVSIADNGEVSIYLTWNEKLCFNFNLTYTYLQGVVMNLKEQHLYVFWDGQDSATVSGSIKYEKIANINNSIVVIEDTLIIPTRDITINISEE